MTHPSGVADERDLQRVQHDVARILAETEQPVEVLTDDGARGADESGHGLSGLADRVEALGGSLDLMSPPGGGTAVRASIPT